MIAFESGITWGVLRFKVFLLAYSCVRAPGSNPPQAPVPYLNMSLSSCVMIVFPSSPPLFMSLVTTILYSLSNPVTFHKMSNGY